MPESRKPDDSSEIEGILSDLDSILSGAPKENKAPPPAPAGGKPAGTTGKVDDMPVAAKPPAAKEALPPAAPAGDPPKIVKLKVSGPAPTPSPPTVKLPPIQAAMPPAAATPPAKAPSPAPAGGKPAGTTGKVDDMPVVPSKPADELKIELPPRSGMILPPEAKPPEKKPTSPGQSVSSYRPPMEIKLDAGPAAPPLKAPGTTGKVDDMPVAPIRPPAVPMAVPADDIPTDIPKDQIRKVAFLYAAGQKTKFDEFIKFIDSMSLHFTKKPLYLGKAAVMEVGPDTDLRGLLEKIKASGAVGVISYLPGVQEGRVRALEEGFSSAAIFYRMMSPEEALKRSAVVDLLVELMLLSSG